MRDRSRDGTFRRYAPELAVLGAAAALLVVARGRFVSPLGDHGIWYSELEGLWRGRRVMRDIHLPYGPLSIVVLRELIRPFPRSVVTVAIAEFMLGLAAALGIIRFSARFLRDRERLVAAALLATVVFWIPGEGSLLYPYTPAVSIGFLFVLAAMSVAIRSKRGRWNPAIAAGAGLLAGLAYLTKQEMGAAAALGVAAAWVVDEDWKVVGARGAAAGAVFLATVAAGYGMFGVDWSSLFPFAPIPPQWRAQYAGVTGMDNPLESFLAVISAAGAVVAAAAGVAALSALSQRGRKIPRTILIALVAGACISVIAGRFHRVALFAVVPIGVVSGLSYGWLRRGALGRPRSAALVSLSAAALPLLTRVGWRGWSDGPFTSIGYSLALPVTIFAVAELFFWFRTPERSGNEEDFGVVETGVLVSLAVLLAVPALLRIGRWPESAVAVSTPRGSVFMPRDWARTFGEVRDFVAASTRPEDEVLFLPQSHGLNFLLQRDSPSPGLKIDPSFDGSGEASLIRTMTDRPPALVVEFDENAQIYGSDGFGTRFGRRLQRWIESRYHVVGESSRREIPFRILKRRDALAR